MVATVASGVDNNRAIQTMRQVYATDRWFTFPKFEETAIYLKSRLEQSGLQQVEIGGARADGVTQAGFWTMPLAWDAREARLEMLEPEHAVLCDYQGVPASLGMWSGPTPKGGVTAELVDITKTPWTDVKGKLVLTDKNSSGYKHLLVKHGALGAVNGFSENPSLRDGRQWINAWGDNGWGFTKASTPLLSFSVTAAQASHLKQLLAARKKVVLHAVADTRYYAGRYPWVTAVLPGTRAEQEVLVLGHTSEQGAQDNATGVSAMIESLGTIERLIEQGKLPRPQRSIRILLMPELYGSLSYISAHPDSIRRTLAAMTVDTPASAYGLAGTEYTFYMNPQVAMSYTDGLVLRIAREYFGTRRPWHWKEHEPGTDSYLGEPTVGIPTVWSYSGTGVVTHHNSEDKPETVDGRSMKDLITVITSYLYFNASAGETQTGWLADITVDHIQEEMEATVSTALDGLRSGRTNGSFGLERIAYLSDRGKQALLTVLKLVPHDRKDEVRTSLAGQMDQLGKLAEFESSRLRSAGAIDSQAPVNVAAEKIVVKRKRIGTLPLDDLSQDDWEGFPSGAWDKLATIALYWCDGKRNLAQVIHLTKMELGETNFDFVGYFRFLERHGYVEFAK